jgi:Fe-S cluster assembly protein SufD
MAEAAAIEKIELKDSILLVFNNGYFCLEMSAMQLLPSAVILSVTATDIKIHIPKNYELPYPIHLVFISSGLEHLTVSSRNIIMADENSQVTIIEEYRAKQAVNYTTNTVTELHAAANARIDYYKLQNEHPTATHLANIMMHQKKDSSINAFFADYGSRLAREEVKTQLQERGAACQMQGVYYLTRDEQQIDNHIYVDHAAAHCSSMMLYKGVLNKKSQATFKGKVYVQSQAQQTQAQQANHNLLLSKDAQVNTKPELEIYADDVKCTHGATVGQLDEEALFYLCARGIEKAEALKLLTQAFIAEVMEKIPYLAIKEYIQHQVSQYADI